MFNTFRTILTIGITFISVNAHAMLSPPPVVSGQDIQVQQYFKKLYDNHNVFNVTNTAPNGSRLGSLGETIIYNNGGTRELWTNTDGEKAWVQIP